MEFNISCIFIFFRIFTFFALLPFSFFPVLHFYSTQKRLSPRRTRATPSRRSGAPPSWSCSWYWLSLSHGIDFNSNIFFLLQKARPFRNWNFIFKNAQLFNTVAWKRGWWIWLQDAVLRHMLYQDGRIDGDTDNKRYSAPLCQELHLLEPHHLCDTQRSGKSSAGVPRLIGRQTLGEINSTFVIFLSQPLPNYPELGSFVTE